MRTLLWGPYATISSDQQFRQPTKLTKKPAPPHFVGEFASVLSTEPSDHLMFSVHRINLLHYNVASKVCNRTNRTDRTD